MSWPRPFDALCQSRGVRCEQVIPDDLDPARGREFGEPLEILLVQGIFDGDESKVLDEPQIPFDQLIPIELLTVECVPTCFGVVPMRRCTVQSVRDGMRPTRLVYGFMKKFESLLWG